MTEDMTEPRKVLSVFFSGFVGVRLILGLRDERGSLTGVADFGGVLWPSAGADVDGRLRGWKAERPEGDPWNLIRVMPAQGASSRQVVMGRPTGAAFVRHPATSTRRPSPGPLDRRATVRPADGRAAARSVRI